MKKGERKERKQKSPFFNIFSTSSPLEKKRELLFPTFFFTSIHLLPSIYFHPVALPGDATEVHVSPPRSIKP